MKFKSEPIENIKVFVENKGGILLSTVYEKFNIKLKFQCKEGHQWEALWASVKSTHTWCPECSGNKKYTLEQVIELCNKANVELLTPLSDYKSTKQHLSFRCKNQHIFFTRLKDLKPNHQCAACRGKAKLDISILANHARSKNGLLLTKEYKNSDTNMLWECEKKHTWEARWSNIRNGRWCPECKIYKYEQICREILESITGEKFLKQKNFIPYNKYCGLELDGYNEKLHLAFEYNGEQHYKLSAWFHKTELGLVQTKSKRRTHCICK